jgi:hypothetical protein
VTNIKVNTDSGVLYVSLIMCEENIEHGKSLFLLVERNTTVHDGSNVGFSSTPTLTTTSLGRSLVKNWDEDLNDTE